MDLENLTKAQLILLTLLVSFMTSIATGIMTVALLGQIPDPVTRTINNVIERTIEKVVPGESKPTPTPSTPASESELIQGAIEKNSRSLVRIYTVAEEGATTTVLDSKGTFRGLGVLVSSDGLVAVPDSLAIEGRNYFIETGNGVLAPGVIVTEGRGSVALMKMTLATATPSVSAATLGNPADLKLGQSVVAIGGETRTIVAVGTISDIVPLAGGGIDTIKVSATDVATLGNLLVTAQGKVVGMYDGDSKSYHALSTELVTGLQKPVTEKPKPTSSIEGGVENTAGAAGSLPLQ